MLRAPLALAVLLCALLAGCGGDNEKAADTQTTTTPEATVTEKTAPAVTAPPDTERYRTAPAPAAPTAPDSGGATAPSPAPQPDSPQNDTRPPPGSPADRFERECETNKEACG